MAKIDLIKAELLKIEGGLFQRLCDSWLVKKGYTNINPIGMMQDTNRVRKGTPDALIIQDDGSYIFSEYTVQTTKLKEKLETDIDKCLEENKTGINISQISEIFICYLGVLSPSDINFLISKGTDHNIKISLYGLDVISQSIFNNYPQLAEEYLSLSLDTGQLLAVYDFVERYNKNRMTTALEGSILFNDEALLNSITLLKKSNFLLVHGAAGVGKTLFSVSLIKKIQELNPQLKSCCLFDKGVDFTADLTAQVSEPGDYLIFVDDANRLDQRLEYILHYLQDGDAERSYKIIVTVRDYAKEIVVEKAQKFCEVHKQEIKILSDEQIKDLLEKVCNINNPHYQQRIQKIAKGNPRLAIMAGKIANENNTLESIDNVASLYDDYFGQNEKVKSILNDKNIMKVVCIISFLRKVDRLNEEQAKLIEDIFLLKKGFFWETVGALHKQEIVDLYEDEVVKISDQILSTYFFYESVFKDKTIKFEDIVKYFYPNRRNLIVDALNPVIFAFDNKNIKSVVRASLLSLYADYQENKTEKENIEFLRMFWFVFPTEALLYAKTIVGKVAFIEIDWTDVAFVEANSSSQTPLVGLLACFSRYSEDNLEISFDLLLDLCLKKQEIIGEFIHLLTHEYSYKPYDFQNGYFVQKFVVNRLMNKFSRDPSFFHARLFLVVAQQLLKIDHTESRSEGNALSITRFSLSPVQNKEILEIRSSIFIGLSLLLQVDDLRSDVIVLLREYVSSINEKEILELDFSLLEKEVLPKLDANNLEDCLLAFDLYAHTDNLNVRYTSALKEKFNNKTVEVYALLVGDEAHRYLLNVDYHEWNYLQKQKLNSYFMKMSALEFKEFLVDAETLLNQEDREGCHNNIKPKIRDVLEVLARSKINKYYDFVSIYLDYDDVWEVVPYLVMPVLFESTSATNIYQLLNNKDFNRKGSWLFFYYQHLPKDQITTEKTNELISLFQTCTKFDLPNSIVFLDRYIDVKNDIYSVVVNILIKRAKEDKYFANPLEFLFFEEVDYFSVLNQDMDLICDAYLAAFQIRGHFDYSGGILDQITLKEPNFLLEVLGCCYSLTSRFVSHNTNFPKLDFLWARDNYIEEISCAGKFVFNQQVSTYFPDDHLFQKLFMKEKGILQDQNLIKKQKKYLTYAIENNYSNPQFLYFVFTLVHRFENEFLLEMLSLFLSLNKEFNTFKRIGFEPQSVTMCGSCVPYYEKHKQQLLAVLPLLTGSQLLEHRSYVEELISRQETRIKNEKKRDYMHE